MSDQPQQEAEIEKPQAAESINPNPEIETIGGETYDAARAMRTIEKLRAEIKELKPKARLAEELSEAEQKRKEAEMTELQKLEAALQKAQTELQQVRLTELKREIAAKVDLPLVFADRLHGNTPEELEADAKKILEALPRVPKPPPVNPTAPGAGASQKETLEQQRARIYGQSVDVMSAEYAASHGGGVVINEKPLTRE